MISLRTRSLLLAAALLLTQALAVVHAFDHPAAQQADHCLYCAHGHGVDHVPADAPPALLNPPACPASFKVYSGHVSAYSHPAFNCRAPPSLI